MVIQAQKNPVLCHTYKKFSHIIFSAESTSFRSERGWELDSAWELDSGLEEPCITESENRVDSRQDVDDP